MKIGQLSELSECTIQTIRYYEKEKLLDPPPRSEGNFRLYDNNALSRLRFIKRCRSLGMTLAEIHQLFNLQKNQSESCQKVSNMIDSRVEEVQVKIKELQQLKTELKALREKCNDNSAIEACGILEDLSKTDRKLLAYSSG